MVYVLALAAEHAPVDVAAPGVQGADARLTRRQRFGGDGLERAAAAQRHAEPTGETPRRGDAHAQPGVRAGSQPDADACKLSFAHPGFPQQVLEFTQKAFGVVTAEPFLKTSQKRPGSVTHKAKAKNGVAVSIPK